MNDVNNCGSCGNQCNTSPPSSSALRIGNTCVSGQCVCGNGPACAYPTPYCINGTCVACNFASGSKANCQITNPFQKSGFCQANGECGVCPAGFGDCNATNINGVADSGASTDCETQFSLERGHSQKCGACGVTCGVSGHPYQSCCNGLCVCGVFNNTADPTSEECAAAIQCSEHEYCDSALGICQPSFRYQTSCGKNAIAFQGPTSYPTLTSDLRTCGHCSDNNTDLIVNGTCTASNPNTCGGKGPCSPSQVCLNGECVCGFNTLGQFPSDLPYYWQPAISDDLDGINRVDPGGKPAVGCLIDPNTFAVTAGFGQRLRNFLTSWISCINAYNAEKHPSQPVTQFTAADFANITQRHTYCSGGTGLCPAQFCDDLYGNFTGASRNSFCNALIASMGFYKSCAASYQYNTFKPDLTCATSVAIYFEGLHGFTDLDLFNFLGCDVPRPDMVYIITGSQPDVNMYRRDVSSKYLASGKRNTIANPILSLVCVLTSSLLLLL